MSCNPSSAIAYYFGGALYTWSGDSVRGTTYAYCALRLSPFDPLTFEAHLALAIAAFHEERYDESAARWAKCTQANPDFGGFVMGQAAALAFAGRMDEARSACARALELEPGSASGRLENSGTLRKSRPSWCRRIDCWESPNADRYKVSI